MYKFVAEKFFEDHPGRAG